MSYLEQIIQLVDRLEKQIIRLEESVCQLLDDETLLPDLSKESEPEPMEEEPPKKRVKFEEERPSSVRKGLSLNATPTQKANLVRSLSGPSKAGLTNYMSN